jgi:hypothetical protein
MHLNVVQVVAIGLEVYCDEVETRLKLRGLKWFDVVMVRMKGVHESPLYLHTQGGVFTELLNQQARTVPQHT